MRGPPDGADQRPLRSDSRHLRRQAVRKRAAREGFAEPQTHADATRTEPKALLPSRSPAATDPSGAGSPSSPSWAPSRSESRIPDSQWSGQPGAVVQKAPGPVAPRDCAAQAALPRPLQTREFWPQSWQWDASTIAHFYAAELPGSSGQPRPRSSGRRTWPSGSMSPVPPQSRRMLARRAPLERSTLERVGFQHGDRGAMREPLPVA